MTPQITLPAGSTIISFTMDEKGNFTIVFQKGLVNGQAEKVTLAFYSDETQTTVKMTSDAQPK